MRGSQLRSLLAAPSVFVGALVLPTALLAATIFFGTGSLWPERPKKGPSAVVVWGDRAFTTRRGFEMWLEANGGDYERWAKRHPAAAALLSRRTKSRRAVSPPQRSAHTASAVPIERRAYYALLGLGGGVAAFLAIAVARRLPRVAIPAVALGTYGAYGANPGRLVLDTPFGRSPPPIRRLRPEAAVRRRRSLIARVFSSCASVVRTLFVVVREVERFDLAFGAVAIALGLVAGMLLPLVLTR
jgi:hypothetical protein